MSRRRLLIAAHEGDDGARRVHDVLVQRHGHHQVAWVSSDQLVRGHWTVRVSENGSVEGGVSVGGTLLDQSLSGVFNRLRWLPEGLWAQASRSDREYAAAERAALVTAWLTGLRCRVVNRPVGTGLAGPHRTTAHWLAAGSAAGLPVRSWLWATAPRVAPGCTWSDQLDPFDTTRSGGVSEPLDMSAVGVGTVVGSRVVWDGADVERWSDAAVALAQQSSCSVLQIVAAPRVTDGQFVVCSVSPYPALATPASVAAVCDMVDGTGP